MTDALQYAHRDHMALGDYYVRHVSAMTAEGLHSKSAIAAELAWRDAEIDRLRAALAAPAVPPGWQLVPVDPTPEMVAAMALAWQQAVERDDPNECIAEYRAALAAAPTAQQEPARAEGESCKN